MLENMIGNLFKLILMLDTNYEYLKSQLARVIWMGVFDNGTGVSLYAV
jgi:hypothetical protein